MPNLAKQKSKYSVWQFSFDGTYKYVHRGLTAMEAVDLFELRTHDLAANIGLTKRVLIVDARDIIVVEWHHRVTKFHS
jgi:hypothetical protein